VNESAARLDMTDLVAIRQYITVDYPRVDRALRTLDAAELKELDAQIRIATFGLTELPSHRGPVFRGTELSEATLAMYQPRQLIREHAFVSATANPALRFPGNATYVIESVNARDVTLLADSQVEREVVFFTGTRFVVLAVDREAGGEATVYLREMPDGRLVRGEVDLAVDDGSVLEGLRKSRGVRDAMALPLRFAASRPDKYTKPIGIDDRGELFPVPRGRGT
jgi:hypothetical protein